MKYDRRIERQLLEYVAQWIVDLDKPDAEAPITYPETVDEISALSKYPNLLLQDQYALLQAYVAVANHRGWVSIVRSKNDWFELVLTDAGYKRLEWHEQADFIPRLTRFAQSLLGVLTLNVLLPIGVSVLTVLAIGQLGVSQVETP